MIKEDYIMRMIKDMVRFLGNLILGKKVINYELPDKKLFTKEDYLYKDIDILLKDGNINEAENLLYKEINIESTRYFELALDFYQRLSEYNDEYLESHNYSKEEVQEGLRNIAKEFGISI